MITLVLVAILSLSLGVSHKESVQAGTIMNRAETPRVGYGLGAGWKSLRVGASAQHRYAVIQISGSERGSLLGTHRVDNLSVNPNTFHSPTQAIGPCAGWRSFTDRSMRHERIVFKVRREIRCAVGIWPISGGREMAYCIAERESGYAPWARNPYSGAAGVVQFIPSTWAAVRERYRWLASITKPSPFVMRSNVLFFARYASDVGLGPWGYGC